MSSPLYFQPQSNRISLPPITALISMADTDPHSTSSTPHNHPRTRTHDGFIDLTGGSPSLPPSPSRHTVPYSRNSKEPPVKRRRIGSEETSGTYRVPAGSSLPRPSNYPRSTRDIIPNFDLTSLPDVEEVDLTEVADEDGLRKIQEAQHQRHKKLQEQQNNLLKESVRAQEPENDGPLKLSKLSCIICMEKMTNVTATHCGHLFCHTCIMEALIAGESGEPAKPQSRCPVCRMKVLRNPKGSTAPQVIPLEIKLLTRSAIAKGKEKVKDA